LKRLLAAAFLAAFLHAGFFLVPWGNGFSRPAAQASRQVMIDLVDLTPSESPKKPHRRQASERHPPPRPPARPEPLRPASPSPAESPSGSSALSAPAAVTADPADFSRPVQPPGLGSRVEGSASEALAALQAKPGKTTVLTEAIPLYRDNPPPAYPVLARKRGYEGTVILEAFVNTNGRVTDLKIHQSSGYAVLDEAALATVKDWHFQPGKKGETPVEMWVRVPIHFQLKGINSERSRRFWEAEGARAGLYQRTGV
jgi:periplasmic protein TonB